VPASSANLGPGYDALAAALDIQLELEVSEVGEFQVDPGADGLPADRDNLCVRAFEALHPADGLRFEIRSDIPVARGLGSSAAAIVAGLLAADHLYELGLDPPDVYRQAIALEGHPDNVAAALFGGFAVCPPDPAADSPATPVLPTRLEPPEGVEGVLAIPDREVSTEAARGLLPAEVPMADAVANIAAASHLVLGIERSDLTLISRGLSDRLHQQRRAEVYPRSIELLGLAHEAGAIGATVSGAGPAVLFWCFWQDTGKVVDALGERATDVEIRRARFTPLGADVPEL
jgi:homoserine kinase